MTENASPGSPASYRIPRQRDRRRSLGRLLGTIARALATSSEEPSLRSTFEDGLRALVPARTIQLRERNTGAAGRDVSMDVLAFEVPTSEPGCPVALEAAFEPGVRVGDWDVQLLGRAANLAALVLALERRRVGPAWSKRTIVRPPRRGGVALIGSTPAIDALRDAVERVARTDFTVLLEGESGVGKELVARLIHERSGRAAGPFIAINCAALVETLVEAELFGIEERTATGVRGRRGKFEAADGGTVFLDEVSDLSPSAQAKLLRAIQELAVERVGATGAQRVDIRIVAATNRPLRGLVDRGAFRPDLFYRLSGVDLHVPSLRERRDDISALSEHFLERYRHVRPLTLSAAALGALMAYDWPGNVRELERVIERVVALVDADVIGVDDLPPAVRGEYASTIAPSVERKDTLRTWARRYARVVLERTGGNKRRAAHQLGISVHTLQAYLRDASPPAAADAEPEPAP